MTQILDLLLLAPDLQESILFLNAGSPYPSLRNVRMLDWAEQRAAWAKAALLNDATND